MPKVTKRNKNEKEASTALPSQDTKKQQAEESDDDDSSIPWTKRFLPLRACITSYREKNEEEEEEEPRELTGYECLLGTVMKNHAIVKISAKMLRDTNYPATGDGPVQVDMLTISSFPQCLTRIFSYLFGTKQTEFEKEHKFSLLAQLGSANKETYWFTGLWPMDGKTPETETKFIIDLALEPKPNNPNSSNLVLTLCFLDEH